jgi:hypothetical protein
LQDLVVQVGGDPAPLGFLYLGQLLFCLSAYDGC